MAERNTYSFENNPDAVFDASPGEIDAYLHEQGYTKEDFKRMRDRICKLLDKHKPEEEIIRRN